MAFGSRSLDMHDRSQRAPIGVLDVAPDGTVTSLNETARDMLDLTESPTDAQISTVFPASVSDSLPSVFSTSDISATEFEEYYPGLDRWLKVTVEPMDGHVTVYVEDSTPRKRSEQRLEELHAEHERIAVINGLLSDILTELVSASSREEIVETTCARLGESSLYTFAWAGERQVGGEEIVVRSAAGETGGTFDVVRDALDEDEVTPEERAVETGEIQAVQPLAEDPKAPESVRVAAFADGIQSMLAIPLTYGSSVYGAVGVYAAGRDPFSEQERASFKTLGQMVGFAVNATRNRNLILSDTITELAFDVSRGTPLTVASDRLDAMLDVKGLVHRSDDSLLCYIGAEEASDSEMADVFKELEGVNEVREIGDADESRSVEVDLGGLTPLLEVASQGATVREATFEDGNGRVVVEMSPEDDVPRLADSITRAFEVDVVAKRERERSVTTGQELQDELSDRLTERQETVLQTAYLADYFESPRGSTAEEVADALDITGSTLLYHLRTGQRKLLDTFFESEPGAD